MYFTVQKSLAKPRAEGGSSDPWTILPSVILHQPRVSCVYCLLHFYQDIMSCTNIIGDRRMVNYFFSPTLIFRSIVSLRPWPLQTSPIRLLARSEEKTQKESSSPSFSPFHVKTAQLPTIDKCKEQHRAGSEGEGGSLCIRLSCRYSCVPSKIGGMTTTL